MGSKYIVRWKSDVSGGSGIVPQSINGISRHEAERIAAESNRQFKPLSYWVEEIR